MLDLTHQLALRGITITILVTPKNLPILHPLLSTHHPSSIQTLVLPFPSHPSLPSGVENFTDIGNAGNLPMINALGQLHDPIIHWFKSHPSPPVAILSAFFLGWTLPLARQLAPSYHRTTHADDSLPSSPDSRCDISTPARTPASAPAPSRRHQTTHSSSVSPHPAPQYPSSPLPPGSHRPHSPPPPRLLATGDSATTRDSSTDSPHPQAQH
ncbi:UDP-glycosyltransferase 89A2-like isoform X2 [Camellia sinensis]|uniref:UDP-glycosyltransferase 89A2-like isoform X2 n=1 Tax=Camellia sinensis TaxID=4442 RepID=UPI001036D26C|nr:UDP-glycosyltransferase 89A2-like isoform X2 [Camellia sinensis]